MLFKIAWRNLWRNRRRTLITSASVFLAVLLAISMRSIQEGVFSNMVDNMTGFYTGYAQIHAKGYWDEPSLDNTFETTPENLNSILQTPNVKAAVPRLESFALVATDSLSQGAQVLGIDPEGENSVTRLSEKVTSGTYLRDGDQAVMIGKDLAKKLGVGVNDTLVLLGQGYQGYSAAGKYPIQAILTFGIEQMNKGIVYLPMAAAQELYVCDGRATSYVLSFDNKDKYTGTLETLKTTLGDSFEVMSYEELMPEVVQFMEADRGASVLTLGILYLIIGFGIFGTVVMMTLERQHEFGVLVAIGMKKGRLSLLIAIESFLVAMLGVVIGYAIAFPLVLYFQANPIPLGEEMAVAYATYGLEATIPMKFMPSIFLTQSLIVFVLVMTVVVYPWWRISHLQPVAAMRS